MAILIVEKGEDEGKSYTILDRAYIGRKAEADIPLLDLKASRDHCVIFRKKGRYFIRDKGSKNGTSVNGKEIKKGKAIGEGDLIRIGLTWLRFQATEHHAQDLQEAFPQYQLIEEIGKGGMGSIYRALHVPLEREVALKILSPELLSEEPRLRDLFVQEAAALTQLSHDNICMLLDFGVVEPFLYFTMELVEGLSLEDYVELHGGLDPEEALRYTLQIARGLAHAHHRGLIHRDIKPRNIMLNRDKKVKIVDFGLARSLSESVEESSGLENLGTLEYISPEQASNQPLDERTDIYSLGASLYEMLTGDTPFAGDTPFTLIHKHVNVAPPPLSKLNPDLPKEVREIAHRCLKKKPKDRYHDCEHLIRDLEKALKNFESSEEILSDLTPTEQVVVNILKLLRNPWFVWIFFPFLGLLLALAIQTLVF